MQRLKEEAIENVKINWIVLTVLPLDIDIDIDIDIDAGQDYTLLKK